MIIVRIDGKVKASNLLLALFLCVISLSSEDELSVAIFC